MAYKLVVTNEGEERIDEQLQYILFELENENAAKHYTKQHQSFQV